MERSFLGTCVLRRRLHRALRRMSPLQRTIFLAMRFDNATIAGLAEAHGLTDEAILAEFAAAIRTLVRTLEPPRWHWLVWWRR
ncbi:MAG: hypothetical protein IH997_05585 [Proteobacteria bacterium]|nr:hypothetical protein [Pseudomonadota bacterium]